MKYKLEIIMYLTYIKTPAVDMVHIRVMKDYDQ
jgi:hypothetical protein